MKIKILARANLSLATALFASFILPAFSQTPPDAGSLQQQIERELRPALPRQVVPDRPAIPSALQRSAINVTVREFRLAGNSLLSAADLAPALAPYLNQPLDFAQLQAAATAVANAYRAAGWVVRAYLPQQDIQNGVVTIQVVESVFGNLTSDGKLTRIDMARVLAYFETIQVGAQPLNANALDRALLLADDLSGVSVAGTLRPGAAERQTDLLLKLDDEPFASFDTSLDNTGSRSSGGDRLSAGLHLASPAQRGDLLTSQAIHSQGSDYLRLAYTTPVGLQGWRVGANGSLFSYKLIAPEFNMLDATGYSNSMGLEATYPLQRARLQNLYLGLIYSHRINHNETATGITSHYTINTLGLNLYGNLFDTLGGGGANSANVSLDHGQLNLNGSPNQAADAASANTQGSYTKLRYNLSRQQVVTPELSLLTSLSGQWASKNLDSSEKFYLGGANGVRAYPSNEGGGTSGQMLNLEARLRLPQGLLAGVFYDWGSITQSIDSAYTGAPAPNNYSLKGYGLNLAWQASSGINIKATWAHRDGTNPNPTATGLDQDGSLDTNRWWLTASVTF